MKQKGITLLEITIVVFLMMLFFGISLPRFSVLFDSDLTREAKKMASIIKNLRTTAILTNKNYKIEIVPKKNFYQVLELDNKSQTFILSSQKNYNKPFVLSKEVKIGKTYSAEKPKNFFAPKTFDVFIDPNGFVDPFSIEFHDQEKMVTLKTINILGEINISPEKKWND